MKQATTKTPNPEEKNKPSLQDLLSDADPSQGMSEA